MGVQKEEKLPNICGNIGCQGRLFWRKDKNKRTETFIHLKDMFDLSRIQVKVFPTMKTHYE